MSKRSRSSSPPSLDISSSPTPGTAIPEPNSKALHRYPEPVAEVMQCALPPHRETLSFTSYEDYEVHYRQAHVNRCSQCSKNFPTGHFLTLHIEENHDPFASARRARGDKTFGCFIETCDRKCSTPQKRRLHLIDKHMFPRSYNFYIINDGIDRQTSMLRPLNSHRRRISNVSISSHEGRLRRRSSASQTQPPVNSPQAPETQLKAPQKSDDMEIDELEKSMSALRFVPTSVARNRPVAPQKKT
ncbi:hypothetical protein N7448_000377 [Penicillium atrosanguineum]|uniref:Uncharacterized protein n=1 Tax=Penicillium atrosanguineum TaxID=1132637 RepID=A0A9W9LCL0_9EURO|nr:hypothetical protein N7448_000377 [Penicillium atrosanguineum]KAJ5323590.1 hypothetical protein N7476_002190 [Penicillium atrosanguineum]